MYNPGKNRTRIEIINVIELENELGEMEQHEQVIIREWAEIKPLTGKEFLEQRKTESEMNYCLKMRYRKDIKEEYKIKFNGVLTDIIYIAPNPADRTMEVVVKWQSLK